MSHYWNIQGTHARVAANLVHGEIDVAYPWRGYQPAASPRAGVSLLKVFTRATDLDTPETLIEHYQRGTDLVATYLQTPERNTRPQIYWRVVEASASPASALEVIVSAQTSLLDSQPLIALESTLPPSELMLWNDHGEQVDAASGAWQTCDVSPCVALFRPRDWSLSYCEMVHPTDFSAMQIELSELPSVRWQLFPESLEKGVIRRGRVRGVFLPREDDEQQALAAFREFVHSPQVLST